MATNSAPTPTLVCKECDYSNEPERVYCHNCGAKLDRSVLPKEEQVRRESPEKARKRIMKMANPSSSVVKREIAALIKTLLFAVFFAGLIQAARPPAKVAPADALSESRMVTSDLSDLAGSPVPRAIGFTENELNTYLRGKVKAGKGSVPGVEYKRSFVGLEPSTGRFTMEKTIYGYSVYFETLYRVQGTDGVFTATNMGGSIGHLPIHPLLMERLSPFIFANITEAFKRERELLGKMQTVTLSKGRVDVVSKGGVPAK